MAVSRRRTRLLLIATVSLVVVALGAFAIRVLGIQLVPPSPQRYAMQAVDAMSDGIEAIPESVAEVGAQVQRAVAGAEEYYQTYPALQAATCGRCWPG